MQEIEIILTILVEVLPHPRPCSYWIGAATRWNRSCASSRHTPSGDSYIILNYIGRQNTGVSGHDNSCWNQYSFWIFIFNKYTQIISSRFYQCRQDDIAYLSKRVEIDVVLPACLGIVVEVAEAP